MADSISHIKELHDRLAQAHEANISDQALAYALMAVGIGAPIAANVSEHEDFIYLLGWEIFVRAPALQLSWLITPHVLLDRIYGNEMSIQDLLEIIECMEEGFSGHGGKFPGSADDKETELRTLASQQKEIFKLKGSALRQAIFSSIQRVRTSCRDSGLLDEVGEHYVAPPKRFQKPSRSTTPKTLLLGTGKPKN